MSRDLLTVIIPCLDEADSVEGTVGTVRAVSPTLEVDVEVVLVDDGSTDATADRMRELCERHPDVRMRQNPRNLGVGRSVIQTLETLDPSSWVTVLPGDNEFIFDSIRAFLEVRDDFDVILGYLKNPVIRTIPRRIASQSFTSVSAFLYGFPYRYLNGMKLYRARSFRGIEVVSSGHAFTAELMAKALLRDPKLRIGEVGFLSRGRTDGRSKAFRPRSVLRALREVYVGHRSVARYRNDLLGEWRDPE